MNLFRSRKLEIEIGGPQWLHFAALDHKTAQALATALGAYPGYRFRPGEEACFKVYANGLKQALKACNLEHNFSTYLDRIK